jgi:hypothetical protein
MTTRYVIRIDKEYFKRTENTCDGTWVKNKKYATKFPWSVARTYIRDWWYYGARMIRILK